MLTLPANTLQPGDEIHAEHMDLHQLHGKTIRKAVFNLVGVKDKTTIADVMIACTDGSAIRIEATGSIKVEILP